MLYLLVPFILEMVDEGHDATHEGPVHSADRRSLADVVTKRHPTTVVDRLDLEHLRVTQFSIPNSYGKSGYPGLLCVNSTSSRNQPPYCC